jgi:hypothetical protein
MHRIYLILITLIIFSGCAKPKTPFSPSVQSNALEIVSSCKLTGNPIDLSVDDSYIYVAEDEAGYALINTNSNSLISEYSNLSSFNLYKTKYIIGNITENEVFFYDRTGTPTIYVSDITDPSHPTLLANITGDTYNSTNLFVSQNTDPDMPNYSTLISWVYKDNELFYFNTAYFDRTNGYEAGPKVLLPSFFLKSFSMDDDKLYIASNQLGVDIVNKDDGHRISLVNTPGEALSVLRYENFLYVADRQAGLQIIDVTDIQNPVLMNDFAFDTSGYAQSLDIDSENNLLSVASGGGGVYVFHLNYPQKPELIDRLDSSQVGYTNITKLHKGKIFIASRDEGIVEISVKNK